MTKVQRFRPNERRLSAAETAAVVETFASTGSPGGVREEFLFSEGLSATDVAAVVTEGVVVFDTSSGIFVSSGPRNDNFVVSEGTPVIEVRSNGDLIGFVDARVLAAAINRTDAVAIVDHALGGSPPVPSEWDPGAKFTNRGPELASTRTDRFMAPGASGTGTSSSNPMAATIANVNSALSSGFNVWLRKDCNISGNVTHRSGTASAPLYLGSYDVNGDPAGKPRINGTIQGDASWWVVRDIELVGSGLVGPDGIYSNASQTSKDNLIDNVTISNMEQCVASWGLNPPDMTYAHERWTIVDTTLGKCGGTGAYMYGNDFTFRRCKWLDYHWQLRGDGWAYGRMLTASIPARTRCMCDDSEFIRRTQHG
jgi:hypothetical protein